MKWNLGPVDLITLNNIALRFNVRLPNSNTAFIAVEKKHYVAIIHKSLIVETALFDKSVSLALFTLDKLHIGTFRGSINPKWLDALNHQHSISFYQDGYAISMIKSSQFRIGAIAAAPFSYFNQTTLFTAMILVPIAGLTGFIFAMVIISWIKTQMSASTLIKNGIKQKEFFLVYQPVFNVSTNQCIGVEALMRWVRGTGESIPPDIFIPLAEKSGLIKSLTEYLMDRVASDIQGIFEQYPDFHVAINVSADDLHSKQILKQLQRLVLNTKAKPGNFIIEATERKLMKIQVVNETLKKVRAHGIKVAIDDFGTGYSNLAYLEVLDLDYLKIDKSFVDAVGTGSSTSQVIFHIIEMSKALNLQIIAEGVETQEQAEFILKQGVQFAQGWHYGKPMPFQKIVQLLKQGK